MCTHSDLKKWFLLKEECELRREGEIVYMKLPSTFFFFGKSLCKLDYFVYLSNFRKFIPFQDGLLTNGLCFGF